MQKGKIKVMPEGLSPIAQYRFRHKFSLGELSSFIGCNIWTLEQIENNLIVPTEEQKNHILTITGIRM